jgi:hypothetical protein
VPRADFYREADLLPEDVLLLVEVADTSLRYDRAVKGPLYAAAGVAEYWIVDVEGAPWRSTASRPREGMSAWSGFSGARSLAHRPFPSLFSSFRTFSADLRDDAKAACRSR